VKAMIRLSAQVEEFVGTLPPQSKRDVRSGLRALADGRGDVRRLEAELEGFCRLRVGRYRIIYRHLNLGGEPVISCEFAEARSIIYEAFAEELQRRLASAGRV